MESIESHNDPIRRAAMETQTDLWTRTAGEWEERVRWMERAT